ncbi:MAG TPA: IPTL-CTERM sorting domain-containing protein [Thermoanaerobaculia bacterium]|nr:IPTL-CTERM sorting domain-containing protein [Thermoanaerobaculia bacterium]
MSLAGGAFCTFEITIQLPVNMPAGTYTNTTSAVSGLLGGEEPVTGPPASDDLTVIGGPNLTKSFLASPVLAGDTVDLEFTLSAGEDGSPPISDIAFTDDLGAALAGLAAIALPADGFCGPGSQISGAGVLSVSGASLAAGGSCTFSVTVQVPAGALPGTYVNTTSEVTGTSEGLAVTGVAASDTLEVGGLVFTKSFTDDPTVAGGTVTLQFMLANLSDTAAVTDAAFSDDLGAVLPGLTVSGPLPSEPCGTGSSLTGMGSTLFLTGGNLATAGSAGDSCTFSVTLEVPAGTAAGQYPNTTSSLQAEVGGEPVTVPPASDQLTVIDPLSIAKDFIDDPAAPGGTVTLQFTVSNAHPTEAATGLTFTDDLDAVVSGLEAVGLPQMDVCGAGSTLSGISLLTLTGGSVAAADSCVFQVTLQVPADAPSSTFLNTTSQLTGTLDGVEVSAPPASAALEVAGVELTKSFGGVAGPGGTVELTFTLTNLSAGSPVDGLGFTDDLDAVLPGLVAVGLPMSDVCGPGSQISGSSVLVFSNGSLAAGGTCDFTVTLEVPADAAPGSYENVTSILSSSGLQVSGPAAADLVIEPAPLFTKAFSPTMVAAGEVATLLFTIDNGAAAVEATSLAFTDVLPAGLVVAAVPNASTTCTGGTLTAVAGGGSISYSGGTVAAGATCTVQVDVTAAAPATYVNTSGELTSSLGSSGPAGATLEVGEVTPLLEIPTVSQWGLLMLALLLGWIGWRRVG